MIEWIGRKNMRWALHIIFWLAVLIFYTFFFGYKSVDYRITFSFVIVLLPVTIITTYFLNYELLPKYLFKKKYLKFIQYFIYTLIVSFYIEMVTVIGIFILVAELKINELHPSNTNALILIAGMYLVVFLGVAVKMVNHYNQNQAQIQSLKKEKLEAELKFLKAQLHPHFLFNTLNNLYSLTLEKSEKASEVVLKLSALLDYILYECNAEFVSMDKEMKQIKNYIELEKLRYGDRLNVEMLFDGEETNHMIPPMLLMTLVENSFKHGAAQSTSKPWIKIKIRIDEKQLFFEVGNSKTQIIKPKKDYSGGVGLKNLQNRLQLLYGDQFDFKIRENSDSYFTFLTLFKGPAV